ncbi:hypothetical protein ABFB09_09495 [Dehalogenimonas sp. THU2]|uniref:hypothetical protein n=1 Tax=Dehalogenimonas sp. THU2 TaxID=3151121 RepID=UPI0032187CCD
MNIVKLIKSRYSKVIIERALEKGFDEKQKQQNARQWIFLSVLCCVFALVLALYTGAIATALFWLYFSGLLVYGAIFGILLLILAGINNAPVLILCVIFYLVAGALVIQAMPLRDLTIPFSLYFGMLFSLITLFEIVNTKIIQHKIQLGLAIPLKERSRLQ